MTDGRKQSLYFPIEMLAEMRAEAQRLDRSLSWMLQKAWAIARRQISSFPAATAPVRLPDDT